MNVRIDTTAVKNPNNIKWSTFVNHCNIKAIANRATASKIPKYA